MLAIRTHFAGVLLIVQLLATAVAVAALVVQPFVLFPEREVMGWAMGVGLAAGFLAYYPVRAWSESPDDRELYALVTDGIYLLAGSIVIGFEVGGEAWLGTMVMVAFWAMAYALSPLADRGARSWYYVAIWGLTAGLTSGLLMLPVYVGFVTGNYNWTDYLLGLVAAALYGILAWRRFSRQIIHFP